MNHFIIISFYSYSCTGIRKCRNQHKNDSKHYDTYSHDFLLKYLWFLWVESVSYTHLEANATYIRTNNSNVTLKGTIHSKGTTVELNNRDGSWDDTITAGSNILTNKGHIFGKIGIGVENDMPDVGSGTGYNVREIRIINNGKITASFQGIFNGDVAKYNKTYIENAKDGEILVNNFEKTTSGDKPYWYNTGIYSASIPHTEIPGEVINRCV